MSLTLSARSWIVALVVLGVPAFGLSAPAGAGLARPAPTVLSLSVQGGAVSGELVGVTGTLKRVNRNRPAAGRDVTIQTRVMGSSTWVRADKARTDADGRYAAEIVVTRSTDVRAVFAGDRRLAGKTSATHRVLVDQYLSLTSHGPAIVDAGDPVWLEGTASPGLRGTRVVLEQRLANGSWRTVGGGSVKSNSTFRAQGVTPVGGFEMPFRVRAPETKAIRSVASDVVPFTVYAWYSLSSMTPLTAPEEDARSVNFKVSPNNRLGGVNYPDSWASLYAANGFDKMAFGRAAFAPQAECSSLELTMGVNDAAGSLASWQFLYYEDGNEYNYGYLGRGQTKKLVRNVTAVNRFRFVNNRVEGTPDDASYAGNAVWGGARIKCAGQP